MVRRDLLKIIGSAGLTSEQAMLYLCGLQLGSMPASAYAKRTGLNRITSYNYLEQLVSLGMFTIVSNPKGKCYAPIPPEELALEARKNVEALERALPELRAMRGMKYRSPQVRFFSGWEGVKHVYADTLTSGTELLNFANSAVVRRYWKEYDTEYVAERVKRGITLRGIAPNDEAGQRVHGMDRESIREIRLVPVSDFNFNNEVNIYDSKVAIISFGEDPTELFGVIIESREVAETQRQIFEMAWRYAGKMQQQETQK